jgi:hypothetical protein
VIDDDDEVDDEDLNDDNYFEDYDDAGNNFIL